MDGSTPILGRRAAAKVATRDRVLQAAKTAFDMRGFSGVDIRTIARSAGLSTGAIFSSFESKETLFTAATGKPAPVGALQDAAPDLLAALKGFMGNRSVVAGLPHTAAIARAAIAKAEGRS